jgi:DNA-directed RNA polymerase subunit F
MFKNLIILILIFSFHTSIIAQIGPKIEFNKKEHKFGDVVEGTYPTTTFVFYNTGDAPLKLKNVRASCGCTSPSWPRNDIQPGDSGVIKVVFNTRGYKNKDFAKSVIIQTNIKNGNTDKTDVVYISGHVVPKSAAYVQYPLEASEYSKNFEKIFNKKNQKWSIFLENKGDSVITIQEIKTSCEECLKINYKPNTINPGETLELKLIYFSKKKDPAVFSENIQIITNIPAKNMRKLTKKGIMVYGEIIEM